MAQKCPIDKMEKLLLATDGSEFSEGAVKEALSMAAVCSSQLYALYVVEINEEFASEAPQLVEKEEIQAGEHLAQVRERAEQAGVTCETAVRIGETPWRIIVEEAGKQNAELIIMGRRGRTGLAKVTMGSVTARVIGHASSDVLVVPRECSLEYRTILVANDGSNFGAIAVREAIKVAEKCGSRLIIISVARSDDDIPGAEETVAGSLRMAQDAGIEAETMTASGKAYRQIVAVAQEKNADLIVMGCHGRTGLAGLLMGSVTERVIGHAKCAVLVACAG